jgi:hypothetical protein
MFRDDIGAVTNIWDVMINKSHVLPIRLARAIPELIIHRTGSPIDSPRNTKLHAYPNTLVQKDKLPGRQMAPRLDLPLPAPIRIKNSVRSAIFLNIRKKSGT